MNVTQELPDGYCEIKQLNFNQVERKIKENLLALLPGILLMVAGYAGGDFNNVLWVLAAVAAALVFCIVYIPVHEVVHGLAFHIMTGVKPEYKLDYKEKVFVCYYPRLFVPGNMEWWCALAPFMVFSVLLIGGTVLSCMNHSFLGLSCGIVMVFHVFCCRGDIWLAREIHRMKDKRLLVREDETIQYFYLPQKNC